MTCYFCNLNKDINIENKKQYNFDISKNYLIKGDNLDVLYAMQDVYKNKVKLIYIDPPYNTKTKRNYKDRFTHQEYLDFMYPRIVLARELLSDDGIIFVSIDDNEQAYLKVLMDEIFGRDNFIGQVVWESAVTKNDEKYISRNHEYILVYKKSEALEKLNGLPRTEKQNKMYKNPDNDPRGRWIPDNFTCCSKGYRYEITTPTGRKYYPEKTRDWRYSETKYKELLADNRVWFGKDGNNKPTYKRFLSEVQNYLVCPSIWQVTNGVKKTLEQLEKFQDIVSKSDDTKINNIITKIKEIQLEEFTSNVGNADVGMSGTKELQSLFNGEKVFNFPKGTRLIKHMLQIATKPEDDDIILDFFAGSGTTGHAVLEKNLEDKGNRKFILIQNDEKSIHKDYSTIFDVCNERLKRVYKKNNIEIDYEVL
jgi:adenine-specific DNA-methyltransferase